MIGVHLDLDYDPPGAQRYAELVAALRKALPGAFVSISVRSLPTTADERKQVEPLFAAADALVAFVFGAGPRVDPVAMDAARRPWWAAYDTRATGTLRGPNGEARGRVPASLLDALSGNPRVDLENDLSANDASETAFTLTVRGPVRVGDVALAPGDRISFHVPSVSEMLFQLGSSLAGKRFALGRAILFDGAAEAERVFSLAAFEDVLLGRSLAPVLEGSVQPAGRSAIAVELVNRSHQASVVSRVSNWIEVDVAPAQAGRGPARRFRPLRGVRRERPGRQPRAGDARPSLRDAPVPDGDGDGRADRRAGVAARRLLPLPRARDAAASGPEVATDWSAPPPTPTPVPKKPTTRKAR